MKVISPAFLTMVLLLLTQSVYGELGGTISGVTHDRMALGGQRLTVENRASFSAHVMRVGGRTVREFANSNGHIFAVSWHGVSDPDLSVLTGNYFHELQTALRTQKHVRGRHPSVIKTTDFTYYHFGHMRDLHGLIYLNGQLPQGTKPEDLK